MLSVKNILENLIFSNKENITYNLDKWIKSKNGKLLITGYTGSGKTTLAEKFSKKYNIKTIELDRTIQIDWDYVEQEVDHKKRRKYVQKQIDNTISKLLKEENKLIIEGVQLFLYEDINKLKNHSIVITKTSMLKSAIRTYNRNKKEPWSEKWSTLDIIIYLYHNLFIKSMEKFIKTVINWKEN
jgi:shikimate kinase